MLTRLPQTSLGSLPHVPVLPCHRLDGHLALGRVKSWHCGICNSTECGIVCGFVTLVGFIQQIYCELDKSVKFIVKHYIMPIVSIIPHSL